MILKFTLILGFLFSFLPSDAQQRPHKTTVRYNQERGVKPKKLSLDIYNYSSDKRKPVVIFVHGGGWLLGDKATKIKKKVTLFTKMGYVFVSINYRLSSFFNQKLQYPTHVTDVADAIKWVFEHITEYGGDNQKLVLLGHSAGAQMISLLATSPLYLPQRGINPNILKGVVSMDTEGYDVAEMCRAGAKIYLRIYGNDPNTWQQASPIFNIQEGQKYPPFLIVMRGKPYRIEMAHRFADTLRQLGTPVELVSGEPYTHFKVNNILGAARDKRVTPKVVAFLKKVVGSPETH